MSTLKSRGSDANQWRRPSRCVVFPEGFRAYRTALRSGDLLGQYLRMGRVVVNVAGVHSGDAVGSHRQGRSTKARGAGMEGNDSDDLASVFESNRRSVGRRALY